MNLSESSGEPLSQNSPLSRFSKIPVVLVVLINILVAVGSGSSSTNHRNIVGRPQGL